MTKKQVVSLVSQRQAEYLDAARQHQANAQKYKAGSPAFKNETFEAIKFAAQADALYALGLELDNLI